MAVDQETKQCYNRSKLGNKTAKFVKTLQYDGAFAKQVDQYYTQCYTRGQLENS